MTKKELEQKVQEQNVRIEHLEQQLARDSEENLKIFFNAAGDGIVIHDSKTGKIIDLNYRACEILGYEYNDLLSQSIDDLSVTEEGYTSDKAVVLIKSAVKNGSASSRWLCRKKNGDSLWTQIDLRLETLSREEKIIAVVRDINDSVIAEEALKESRSFLQLIMDTIPMRVFWKDCNSIYLGCNQPLANDAGFANPEELIGKNDFDCSWTNEAELYRQDDKHVMDTGNPKLAYEEPQTTAGGKTIWLRTSKVPLRDPDGNIYGVLGTYEDITETIGIEQAHRESEARYRSLIQNSSDAIYLLYNRRFEIINDKFSELFGLTLEEVNSESFDFMQLVSKKSHHIIEDRMKRYAAGEKLNPKYEFTALTKDGKELEVETSTSHINIKGQVATQGIIRDITKRKRLEEQLRHTQKIEAVGRLAGGVAHDFNNLLTVINGYCELLLHRDLSENIHSKINQIYNAGIKAGRLTSQLLAFSRKQVIQTRVVSLNSIISEMNKMLHRLLGTDIEIVTILNPELWHLKADPGQIEQIIINLVVNARDAMPDGGKLYIESDNIELDENIAMENIESVPGKYIVMSIQDSGFGMDKEVQSHIFEPFFTTKERGKGTGLGLSTVYGIVKQNSGYIQVESEPDKGSVFKVFFPKAETKIKENKTAKIHKQTFEGKETILVVEDDIGVRDLTISVLKKYGYNILFAENGEDALKVVNATKNPIDLLLTDVIMPKMGGKELAEKMVKNHPSLKIVFFSGYTDGRILGEGSLQIGMDFIQKPFSQENLIKKIRAALDEPVKN